MNKTAWVKPELVILVRSNPEEAVLENCKGTGSTGTPNTDNINCQVIVVPNCSTYCDTHSSS